MTQFHEGQEVEVATPYGWRADWRKQWRKAKIVALPHAPKALDDGRKFTVQFQDGTTAIFSAEHISVTQ